MPPADGADTEPVSPTSPAPTVPAKVAPTAAAAPTASSSPSSPASPESALLAAARQYAAGAVSLRRSLHSVPEVGLQVPETQRRVLRALDGLGLEIRTGRRLTSVTALLRGARRGPTLLLRADMDALPVHESTGREFASRAPGVMHACGHDAHTAMLAGAARLLAGRRGEIAGQVVFMFQPGEEGCHGARHMIDEGVLECDGRPVDAAFALHVMPGLPSGTLHLRPGPQMAASDRFRVVVRGRGGHASAPHDTADPVPVACETVLALQTAMTRRVAAADAAVLTVSGLSAGSLPGVIPETAELTGTLRTVSASTREFLHTLLVQVADGVAAAHGVRAEVVIEQGYPPTVNDAGFTDFVLRAAADVLGPGRARVLPDPGMTAEDFSYVLNEVPGALAFLGACPPGLAPERAPALHSSRADIDEGALAAGIACHSAVALRFLSGRPRTAS
ncbi:MULTISPECIES: M20 family metallopeptidase [unclassified Streptomyces]|uniref:M20 metallopeptidase family protein n=1 Tax=unclassified Streptomyces TaxID=2593676 RepID=UPI002DD80121|nr:MULTISPECIES: M20 family metallopeptidase [unclassified Streptomyces]WSB74467.1 M20 family metallopeptidase [Streptomyces sp. NBC_01775]WSS17148.1 M20 family metallopeptidase [Streptomyces sp. NBC_01186]WSS45895.1 M20 family metallopeptidase [Streptomyces sp. NBC_01187]